MNAIQVQREHEASQGAPWRWTNGLSVSPFRAVQLALGLLLLTAAGLKTHQLATEPVMATGVLESRWFLIAIVEFELLFGIWLLSGLYPRSTWVLAVVCFVTFSCYSLWKATSGAASCGCFGKVEVNPWHTFIFDVAAVGVLLLWRPRDLRRMRATHPSEGNAPDVAFTCTGNAIAFRKRNVGLIGVWLVVAVSVGAVAELGVRRDALVAIGQRVGDTIVVEPQHMVGQPFELGKHIDIGERLAHGRWLVVLYRVGCPDCESFMMGWPDMGPDTQAFPATAFVSVPPGSREAARSLPNVSWGTLRDDIQWFLATPMVVTLHNNRVLDVRINIDLERERLLRPEQWDERLLTRSSHLLHL